MSLQRHYWRASAALAKTIIKIFDKVSDSETAMHKLVKRVGADGFYYSDSGPNREYTGFRFHDPAKIDRTLFAKLRRTDDGWKPRARTDLAKEVEALSVPLTGEICDLLKMHRIGSDMTYRTPGVRIVGKAVYLALPTDVKPPNCTRITDVTYERATVKQPKKKARKKVS